MPIEPGRGGVEAKFKNNPKQSIKLWDLDRKAVAILATRG
jgi:hypothetical protein